MIRSGPREKASTLLSLVAPSANRFLYVGLALLTYPIGFVV